MTLLEPRQRGPGVSQSLDVAHDPAPPAQPRMRREEARVDRPPLVFPREPEPEIRVLGAKREAREEALSHEVAPAPEHRRDLHSRPRADDLVERAGRARATPVEAPARASPRAQTAHPSRRRYGQTCV